MHKTSKPCLKTALRASQKHLCTLGTLQNRTTHSKLSYEFFFVKASSLRDELTAKR